MEGFAVITLKSGRSARVVRLKQGKFSVAKLGATRFDLREPYYIAVTASWPVFILLCIGLLITVVALFAGLFLLQPLSIHGVARGDFARAFFFSLEVISTAGFGVMAPASIYGYVIAGIERVLGIAMLPVVTGLLFARISRAKPGILFASCAVVTRRDGAPQLRVRVANCKSTMLTGAKARMSVLLRTYDQGGEVWRRYHDLKLVRDFLPLFPLTWTLMHTIDEESPLHGMTEEDLADAWGQLIVMITAQDARVGRQVENIGDYAASEILFGKHYLAAIDHADGGVSTADITRLSLVGDDPLEGRAAEPARLLEHV